MNVSRNPDSVIAAWLDEGPAKLPIDTRQAIAAGVRTVRRRRAGLGLPLGGPDVDLRRFALALGGVAAVVIAAVLMVSFYGNLPGLIPAASSNPSPSPSAAPAVDLGIFEPVAGRIVYGDQNGIWGVDPAPSGPATRVQLTAEAGDPLGWSSDGTRLLIARDEHLFVLNADSSQTQVTDRPMASEKAAISPDGSRVVFAGQIEASAGVCRCALYTVDVDGDAVELLLESRDVPWGVTFSPDGTQIAYVEGGGDHSHRVWVVNVDGTEARQILAKETTLGPAHVRGLAWSPAGDRIAIGLETGIYTFAPDGSAFTRVTFGGGGPYWSPDGTQLAFTWTDGRIDVEGVPIAASLLIADADGSNVREYPSAMPGPWHPGTPPPAVGPTPAPSPSGGPTPAPAVAPPFEAEVSELLNTFLQARIAGVGAEQYLDVPDDVVFGSIPLLYATTSGAPYERAELESVIGVEWPYGFTAFRVRLFAGNTVVEQLLFTPQERAADGRLKLVYVPDGFGTDIAPTTQDGQPVARPYIAFDGEVTLHVGHPWVFHYDGGPIKLIPEDARPTTDGGQRNDWPELSYSWLPKRIGSDCQVVSGPADAAAVAESIRSVPYLETTAPVAVGNGGAEGLMIDVKIAADANAYCLILGLGKTDRMRLYLFDAPVGISMRTLAVKMIVPDARFETAMELTAPISVEFHAPLQR